MVRRCQPEWRSNGISFGEPIRGRWRHSNDAALSKAVDSVLIDANPFAAFQTICPAKAVIPSTKGECARIIAGCKGLSGHSLRRQSDS